MERGRTPSSAGLLEVGDEAYRRSGPPLAAETRCRSTPRAVGRTQQRDPQPAPPFWIHAALRSVIWLGAAAGLAHFKKPDGASLLAVRTDAIGWLGGGIVLAGLAFHFWSSVTLARGERPGAAASTPVADGPFRYVRNPIDPGRHLAVAGRGLALFHLACRGPGLAAALICGTFT